MTYEEWQDIKKWLIRRVKAGDFTQEDADTYIRITQMMHGKRGSQCLECVRNDGNFQKGECSNCPIWDSF